MDEYTTAGCRCPLCGAMYIGSHACSRNAKDWYSKEDTIEKRLDRIEKKLDELIERIEKWKSSK